MISWSDEKDVSSFGDIRVFLEVANNLDCVVHRLHFTHIPRRCLLINHRYSYFSLYIRMPCLLREFASNAHLIFTGLLRTNLRIRSVSGHLLPDSVSRMFVRCLSEREDDVVYD